MKSLSKKCILITVLLQLCFRLLVVNAQVHITNNPNFGDIVVFPTSVCGIDLASHYAIYVDNVDIPGTGKLPTQNLFHMTKQLNGQKGECGFGESRREFFTVDNSMDENETVGPRDQQTIINRIIELNRNCGTWTLSNTCEHVATHIRYGEAHRRCIQNDTWLGSLACQILNPIMNPGPRKRSLKRMIQRAPAA